MEIDTLKTLGEIAGIGGIALGVLLILFREILRRADRLPGDEAGRLYQLMMVLVWSVGVLGVGAWAWTETRPQVSVGTGIGIIGDVEVDGNLNVESGLPEETDQ